MAAQLSSLKDYCYKDDPSIVNQTGKSTALITQDLLGGSSFSSNSRELDLDLQVPNGWEKRPDLKSGKVYIQRSNSPNSSTSNNQKLAKLQDPTFHSSSSFTPSKLPLNMFDDTNLDLKLDSRSPSCNYQSVCILDKVKFALDRFEGNLVKRRPSPSNPPPPYLNKVFPGRKDEECDGDKSSLSLSSGLLFAAGCPNCLIYVMISKNSPRCPRCNSNVPFPVTKKTQIDLNLSI